MDNENSIKDFLITFLLFGIIFGTILLLSGCSSNANSATVNDAKFQLGDSVIFKNDPALPMVVQQIWTSGVNKDNPDSIEYKCRFRGMYTIIKQTDDGPQETKVGFDTDWFHGYELQKYEIQGEFP